MSHSGFLKFESVEQRNRFVGEVLVDRPEIMSHVFVPRSGNRPEIVLENIDDDQLAFVQSPRGFKCRWIDDIQFRTM